MEGHRDEKPDKDSGKHRRSRSGDAASKSKHATVNAKKDKHSRAAAAKKRMQLVNELLQSERTHVYYLNKFVTDFVIPLRDKRILSPEEQHDILSNIELIRSWNVRFLQSLETLLDDDAGFGELFLEMLPLMRQLYAQYNENYAVALESYERAQHTKEFAQFVEKANKDQEEEHPGRAAKSFLSFLYLPIQRMIAYDSLLTNLTNETPEDHPDHANLKEALTKLREATSHAEKLANQRKNIDKVLQIQSLLIGDPAAGECPSLAQPHRRFVHEGEVTLVIGGGAGASGVKPPPRESARRLFLFNDVLLCVQQKKKQKGEKSYKVDFLEPLDTLRVEDRDCEDSRYRFTLFSAAKEYTLQTDEKGYWIQLIRDTIHRRREGEDGPTLRRPTHRRGTSAADADIGVGIGYDNGGIMEDLSRGVDNEQILAWAKLPDVELVAAVRQHAATLMQHRTYVNPSQPISTAAPRTSKGKGSAKKKRKGSKVKSNQVIT